MNPRILLVGNYPADGQESMLRFARMLHDGLAARGADVRSISPRAVFGGGGRASSSGWGKWLAYVDKFVLFPWVLRRKVRALSAGGVVHICDHSNAMYARAAGSAGHGVVVTCHDLGAVRGALGEATDCPASATGKVLQRWIAGSLGRADIIACDSTATRLDVERLIRRPDGTAPDSRLVFIGLNVPYVPLGPGVAVGRLSAVPGLDPRHPYVLNVGSSLPRKNRAGVLRIFAKLADEWPEGRVVFAGEPLPDDLVNLARELRIGDRVVQVVKPPDVLLEALYNEAAALLFPSRFEGFGWPVIEAQACGCPVLCSDAGSLGEVAGDSAFVRAVDDEGAFASELLRLARDVDGSARARWAAAGFRNLRRFDADLMIGHYEALYEEASSRHASGPAAAHPAAVTGAVSSR